jgi:uncharacterized membrane protein YqjE
MQTDNRKTIPDLLGDLVTDMTGLFRTETRLVRAELAESVRRMSTGVELIGAGGIILLVALLVLVQALVIALSNYLGASWASLAVGIALAVIGAIMVSRGKSDLSASTLIPERTVEQASRDAQLVKEQIK